MFKRGSRTVPRNGMDAENPLLLDTLYFLTRFRYGLPYGQYLVHRKSSRQAERVELREIHPLGRKQGALSWLSL